MATIIDALLVTLGLDTTEFKKGQVETQAGLKETERQAESTARTLQHQGMEAGEFFAHLIEGAAGLLGLLAGAHELKEFAHQFLEMEDQVGKFSRMLDINIEDLQGWQRAIQLEGGTVQGFQGIVEHLTSTLALIQIHGPRSKMALKLFEGLGIGEAALKGKDTFEVMKLISDQIQNMPKGLSVGLLERMGFDKPSILLMQKGREEIEKIVEAQKRHGTVSKEDAEAAEKFNDTMLETQFQWGQIVGKLVNSLLPALQMFADGLKSIGEWAGKHPAIIRSAIIGIAGAFLVLALSLIPVVIELLPIELSVLAIAAAVGILAAMIGYLAFEWQKWTSGGVSALGPLFEAVTAFWNRIRDVVMTVLGIIKEEALDSLKVIADEFALFFALLSGDPKAIEDAWDALGKSTLRLMHLLRNSLIFSAAFMLNSLRMLWNHAWDEIRDYAIEQLNKVEKALSGNFLGRLLIKAQVDPAKSLATYYANSQKLGSAASLFGPAPNMHHSEKNVEINGPINIHTQSTDAKGILHEIPGLGGRHALIDAAEGAY